MMEFISLIDEIKFEEVMIHPVCIKTTKVHLFFVSFISYFLLVTFCVFVKVISTYAIFPQNFLG